MVCGRARPQLGLQSRLPRRPSLIRNSASPAEVNTTRFGIFVLEMFRSPARLRAASQEGIIMSCSIRAALRGALACLAVLTLSAAAMTGPAAAQDRRQNAPGEFDYYVLSLSWSPS